MINDVLGVVVPMCLRFEGVRLRPYLCPAGVPTIGAGAVTYLNGRRVSLADPSITREEAVAMLKASLRREYLPAVLALCPGADNTERIAALTDFAYNLGTTALRGSTLRKRVNEQDWEAARREILRWTRGGGRVLPGLVSRRRAEAALI